MFSAILEVVDFFLSCMLAAPENFPRLPAFLVEILIGGLSAIDYTLCFAFELVKLLFLSVCGYIVRFFALAEVKLSSPPIEFFFV